MNLTYYVLDVFTQDQLAGNPLAVVCGADGLDTDRMQGIAREFNLSETVFVMDPEHEAHSARVRIFTPKSELPFAGHPTVGTAILLAQLKFGEVSTEQDAIIVLEENIGAVRVGVRMIPGTADYAEFDAPRLPGDAGATAPEDRIAAALGLATSEIGFENHHPSRFNAGMPFTFVPVDGLDAIRRAHVVHAHWEEAFRGDELMAAFVYCRETVRQRASYHARMFAPMMGVPEDPATGSAAAAFAGAINRFDRPADGLNRYEIEQGFEMGRPSEIVLEAEVSGRTVTGLRIGGHAVHVARGELALG
ncbi:PhzF family phenazine biosynthesis protein [Dichotomicrobium thermohalophilum]|uniref:Trans-2,3-dihydro-3-hydroxyanthranilate isomerase n=1 Tax=Dichotomicrobium thermohalophilum TaxID=933063 RepID=A0A397PJL5_9HYPH|nr:PhzF family phenazine biosynthesis protein [Dichotomicrobium thermohalophilum]RIA47465.1 trans-2,3-dihydro-3-hydroxyanthranilate isomerase [Dichotomicrobium thermohalophilum]